MRYVMKQKWMSLGEDFTIKDEQGSVAFVVDGKAVSVGAKAALRDAAGAEVAFIKQKVASLTPTYEILRDGQRQAIVKQKLALGKRKLSVSLGSDTLDLVGNVWDHEFRLARGGQTMAEVSKKWFSMTDSYGIDVADGQDDAMIIALVAVIDMMQSRETARPGMS